MHRRTSVAQQRKSKIIMAQNDMDRVLMATAEQIVREYDSDQDGALSISDLRKLVKELLRSNDRPSDFNE